MFSPAKRREIIFHNYQSAAKKVTQQQLSAISLAEKVSPVVISSENEEGGCGDSVELLVKVEEGIIKKCCFAADNSCLITVAFANLLCLYLEKKPIELAKVIITELEKMIAGETYQLEESSNLAVFDNIINFPHRINCLKIVING
jgi:NifU-like protein involved in Fe-S cluster formation